VVQDLETLIYDKMIETTELFFTVFTVLEECGSSALFPLVSDYFVGESVRK